MPLISAQRLTVRTQNETPGHDRRPSSNNDDPHTPVTQTLIQQPPRPSLLIPDAADVQTATDGSNPVFLCKTLPKLSPVPAELMFAPKEGMPTGPHLCLSHLFKPVADKWPHSGKPTDSAAEPVSPSHWNSSDLFFNIKCLVMFKYFNYGTHIWLHVLKKGEPVESVTLAKSPG